MIWLNEKGDKKMHIHELTLERFRGAYRLTIPLHEKLNVFVGMNGAGKSTILDAAAILLSWLVNRINREGATGRPVVERDIMNGKSSANLIITMFYKGLFSWNLAKTKRGYSVKDASTHLVLTSIYAKLIREEIEKNFDNENLPLFVYYPVNRAVIDIPLRIREKHRFDLFSANDDALTSGASFRTFFEWFREREDLENENRRYIDDPVKPEGFQFPDMQLEAVRKALHEFMPGFSGLTVRRNPLRMEVEKNGKKLLVNQLSDGEKCLMAMVGDLARRLAIANPVRDNPLEGDGVVLIDEIDLHLHPKWQRLVVPNLVKVFPNCQFLISTHSPHVVTHVQPENLFLLRLTDDGLKALRPSESYGKTVERVLEDLMGLETTRPDEVKASMRNIYELIDRCQFDSASNAIDVVQEQIGEDPELVKARLLMRRKELIGK